ncbi:MAG: prepilin-type N-terminal cleavage/methylation domain-containing protein [Verrucomicrobiota bacterium]
MYLSAPRTTRRAKGLARAFTLVEVVLALALLALVLGGVILAYVQTCNRAQWTGYALAAQGLVMQRLEQARAAAMDPNGSVCELTNIAPGGATNFAAVLDLPVSGTNYVWATNYVGIRLITNSVNPLVTVYMVRADTVWPLARNGVVRYFSNTAACYYSQDY